MNSQTRPDSPFRKLSVTMERGCRHKGSPRANRLIPPTILALATPSAALDRLLAALAGRGYEVLATPRPEEALQHLARPALDLLLVELGGGWQERLAVIQAAQNSVPPLPVILVGSQETPPPTVAFHLEVADYLLFPEAEPAAVRRVDRALGRPHRRDRPAAEARIATLNLKALLRMQELVTACADLLQVLSRAPYSPESPAPGPQATAMDPPPPPQGPGAFGGRVIDLEAPA